MALKVRVDYRHTREIDNNDKYYVVKCLFQKEQEMEVGWIDKSFDKEKFLKDTDDLEIIEVIEFADKSEYELYKNS